MLLRPLAFESSFNIIASKLNAGCGGYLDKIYKIFDGIFDLIASFPFKFFFHKKQLFWFENKNFSASKKVTNQLKFNKKLLQTKKFAREKLA